LPLVPLIRPLAWAKLKLRFGVAWPGTFSPWEKGIEPQNRSLESRKHCELWIGYKVHLNPYQTAVIRTYSRHIPLYICAVFDAIPAGTLLGTHL